MTTTARWSTERRRNPRSSWSRSTTEVRPSDSSARRKAGAAGSVPSGAPCDPRRSRRAPGVGTPRPRNGADPGAGEGHARWRATPAATRPRRDRGHGGFGAQQHAADRPPRRRGSRTPLRRRAVLESRDLYPLPLPFGPVKAASLTYGNVNSNRLNLRPPRKHSAGKIPSSSTSTRTPGSARRDARDPARLAVRRASDSDRSYGSVHQLDVSGCPPAESSWPPRSWRCSSQGFWPWTSAVRKCSPAHMRASMSSVRACEKLSKLRVPGITRRRLKEGGRGRDLVAPLDHVAEEHRQHAGVRAVEAEMPRWMVRVRGVDERGPRSDRPRLPRCRRPTCCGSRSPAARSHRSTCRSSS